MFLFMFQAWLTSQQLKPAPTVSDDNYFADIRTAPCPDSDRYGRLLRLREAVTV